MRKTQNSKINHLSNNGLFIAKDTDIVLPNVDKNNRIIKINRKSINNRTNHSTST